MALFLFGAIVAALSFAAYAVFVHRRYYLTWLALFFIALVWLAIYLLDTFN